MASNRAMVSGGITRTQQPRYSKEEHARRGTALYEQHVRLQVETGNLGRIVALDVDSGAFEVAEDTLTASQRLPSRCPDAQIWCVRIGYPAVRRFTRFGVADSGRAGRFGERSGFTLAMHRRSPMKSLADALPPKSDW